MAGPTSRRRMIAIRVLKVFLGLTFLTIGAAKLSVSLGTVGWFAQLGWGQWFRYLTGLLDVIGALLLFVPRWTSCGALVLTGTIGMATVLTIGLHLHQNPVIPLVLTFLAGTLAWLARPRADTAQEDHGFRP